MTDRGNEFLSSGVARQRSGQDRSRVETGLFAVGLTVVGANSALYFFGVESLSHPAASLLGLALLVPLALS